MEEAETKVQKGPEFILNHAFGASAALSLTLACILVLTYGTGQAFAAIRWLFLVFIAVTHALSLIKQLIPFKLSERGIKRKLWLSPDVHYFTLFLLFTIGNLTPILIIANYLIWLSTNILSYVITDLLPLTGDPDPATLNALRGVVSHNIVVYAPPVFELILFVQLFVITIADLGLISLITFFVYITWIMMFNYANSTPHNQVWSALGKWFGGIAETNKASYGPGVATIIDKIGALGDTSIRWYMNDVSK
jgi:hypothetical protein